MFQIAGGIILAVIGLAVLRFLYELIFVPVPVSKAVAEKVKSERDGIVEEGRLKHLKWEKGHPIAKHLYHYDETKYLRNNRNRK